MHQSRVIIDILVIIIDITDFNLEIYFDIIYQNLAIISSNSHINLLKNLLNSLKLQNLVNFFL
ncbi:unnamed protein product [Brugia timori]|uniref:Uncharacterized protein n=1 Tax=Brugia timori TaxID=42155 RepID=A0A3P7WS89_9BILA|nr:unnamed protein product [Brugia timori]